MTEPTGQDCPRCHRRGNRVWSRWALWAPVGTFTTDFMTDVGQVLRNEDGSSHQERARRPRDSGSHGHVGRGRKEDVQACGTLLRAQERRGGVCGPPPGPRVCACARVRVCAHVHVCAHVCVSLTACFLSVPSSVVRYCFKQGSEWWEVSRFEWEMSCLCFSPLLKKTS